MIRFGVAGYPPAYAKTPFGKDRLKVFEWLKTIGLDAFEAQMTYGPRTSLENCDTIRRLSQEFDIKVSVHASYYIVLTSSEEHKIRKSIDTLKRTFDLADRMGANVVVLHPGSYYASDPDKVFDTLTRNLHRFFQESGPSHIGLFLETAGKKGQLGSVEEILQLARLQSGCYPCIDFGHVHARTCGGLARPEAIDSLFCTMREYGAFTPKNREHFHYTPIDFGPQGEITHKALEDVYPVNPQQDLFDPPADIPRLYHPRYERIIENLSRIDIPFTVISETHNSQEQGALALKSHYRNIL